MLNRRQKGVILLAASLFGSAYMMLTDRGYFDFSLSQLLVALWIIVLAAFGIYLLFVAED